MKVFVEEEVSAPAAAASGPLPAVTTDDRRKYLARIPLELRLRLTAVNYSGPARSLNLSVTGLLIETSLPLIPEERVILTVMHPDGQGSFNICAEVMRVAAASEQSKPGCFGLRILNDDSLAWHNFLRLLVLR